MSIQNLLFTPNASKELSIDTEHGRFLRYPVKTHVITESDDLPNVLHSYVQEFVQPDDTIFISEKIVSITQGRAVPIEEIHPGWWAQFLCKFVHKTDSGIGLGMPCTMEMAIQDLGLHKILFAAMCSGVTKCLGIRGVFYRILGKRASSIDGPCDVTLPPYNQYVSLMPEAPDDVAEELAESIGANVVVIDANDLGVEVLGRSDSKKIDVDFCKQVFRDNPLGQCIQQTPLCIVRRI